MAVEEETPDLLDEAELGRRRASMRKFPLFKPLPDERLNEIILEAEAKKKTKKRKRGVASAKIVDPAEPIVDPPVNPELQVPESWCPEFRRLVKEHLARVKDDVDVVLFKPIIENHVLNILDFRLARMLGASVYDREKLNAAVLATATALGLTEPRRHIRQKKGEDALTDAFTASVKAVEEGKQGLQEKLQEVERRLENKHTPTETSVEREDSDNDGSQSQDDSGNHS